MSKTIYKYSAVPMGDVWLPQGASVVLFDGDQAGLLWIWAEVDPSTPVPDAHAVVRYTIYGTGFTIPKSAVHVASCIAGAYVWHLYRNDASNVHQLGPCRPTRTWPTHLVTWPWPNIAVDVLDDDQESDIATCARGISIRAKVLAALKGIRVQPIRRTNQ